MTKRRLKAATSPVTSLHFFTRFLSPGSSGQIVRVIRSLDDADDKLEDVVFIVFRRIRRATALADDAWSARGSGG